MDSRVAQLLSGSGLEHLVGGIKHAFTPAGYIKQLKVERKRETAPHSVVAKAEAAVRKLESIPYKKMSAEKASHLHWGENPNDAQSVLIDLPIVDVETLRIRDVRNHTIYHTPTSLKNEGFKIFDKGCIVTHKGEILTIYITGADDRAVRECAKQMNKLIDQMKAYYPRKAATFYSGFDLVADKAKRAAKKAERAKKTKGSPEKYHGWNALDGMIRHFTAVQHGNVYSYHPRNPIAAFDNDFLFNLIYTYNAIYALEKRYAPAVAQYRYDKAHNVDKAPAIPGDPLKALPATSLGASEDFASALHDDSGIKGITESIVWSKVKPGEKSYFVNDQTKMAFDLSKDNAMIMIPPKCSHGTANTGDHGGCGFVIITKANQVWDTADNRNWQKLWRDYASSAAAKNDFAPYRNEKVKGNKWSQYGTQEPDKDTADAELKDKRATGAGRGGVSLKRADFIKEHMNLLDILKKGSPAARKREAADQAKELAGVLGGSKNGLAGM